MPCVAWRLPKLKSENTLDSVLSRETAFLTQNVVFVLIMAATFLGTIFPSISELVTGDKISLNAPYFMRVNGPIFVVLLVLMGVAPLLAWRRSGPETLRRNFLIPIVARPAQRAAHVPARQPHHGRLRRDRDRHVRVRRASSRSTCAACAPGGSRRASRCPLRWCNLVRRNGRRYGGYIVHIGVLLVALGIIGNEFYQSEGEANLAKGESMTVANYTLTYERLDMVAGAELHRVDRADDAVTQNGRPMGEILPKKHIYNKNQEQPMSEVGLRPGLVEDVYVVLAGWDNGGETASFKVFVNPLMSWMWVGGIVMMIGVLISAWPRRIVSTAEATRRVPESAQPA